MWAGSNVLTDFGRYSATHIKGVEVDDTDKANGRALTYSSTSGKLEYEAAVAGGDTVVDRGDCDVYDFSTWTMTFDGEWHTFDLSGIVPVGTKFVFIVGYLHSNPAGFEIGMRKGGYVEVGNMIYLESQVLYKEAAVLGFVGVNEDREIEYYGYSGFAVDLQASVSAWIL